MTIAPAGEATVQGVLSVLEGMIIAEGHLGQTIGERDPIGVELPVMLIAEIQEAINVENSGEVQGKTEVENAETLQTAVCEGSRKEGDRKEYLGHRVAIHEDRWLETATEGADLDSIQGLAGIQVLARSHHGLEKGCRKNLHLSLHCKQFQERGLPLRPASHLPQLVKLMIPHLQKRSL
mmetsp:Transcript_48383/g.75408  ORF Transcript_48383/g.75408 Transcript_48383/m.75408 type:complete len:179 (-) Transcript_48383:128-664(-)